MSVLLEISEFVSNPVRTGIQRVVRELIANWPATPCVRFCAYAPEADMLYELPDRAIRLACEGAASTGIDEKELKVRIAEADSPNRRRVVAADEGKILIPEIFYEPSRMEFYRRLNNARGISPAVIVHDFSAYFDPDAFKITATGSNFFLPYLYLVRAAAARSFSTERLAREYETRIARADRRHPADMVTRLGSDSLGTIHQIWAPQRRTIVCIGSFDGKKNQHIIFEAYRSSPRLQAAFELVFIGRKPEAWQASDFVSLFLNDLPGVRTIEDATDDVVREVLGRARATVFIGTSEGFGLPAVESLAVGIPLVAWAGLPALIGLSEEGQIRLDAVTVETTREALERLLDDRVAEGLWQGAASLRLQTWKDFATAIGNWMVL